MEEFQNYKEDKWWWFATYLDLGATICANPQLSAKNRDFSEVVTDFLDAMNEYERQRRRSLFTIYGIND